MVAAALIVGRLFRLLLETAAGRGGGRCALTLFATHFHVAHDLSPQAVSQALNDYEGTVRVSAETRERVRSLATRWNYRPHAGARALRRKTSQNIGFIEVRPLLEDAGGGFDC